MVGMVVTVVILVTGVTLVMVATVGGGTAMVMLAIQGAVGHCCGLPRTRPCVAVHGQDACVVRGQDLAHGTLHDKAFGSVALRCVSVLG